MNPVSLPLLYSFRRCPYAIRARLALQVSGVNYALHEVHLRDKPASMLEASPKGSVPVLVLPDGHVIDESWDIMLWSLQQHDPENWLGERQNHIPDAAALVAVNDKEFKRALDLYKYASRHPEHPSAHYRAQGEMFLLALENHLQSHPHLLGPRYSIADAAILPFIRQFAGVDPEWFAQSPYPRLRDWTATHLNTPLFEAVMQKNAVWKNERNS